MRLEVPVAIKGEAPGVKTEGGILDVVLREIEIEWSPRRHSSSHRYRCQQLEVRRCHSCFRSSESDKIKYLSDPEMTVVHVTAVKEEVVATPEAAATDAAAGPAEPEVIKKGKTDAAETPAAPEKGGDKGKK